MRSKIATAVRDFRQGLIRLTRGGFDYRRIYTQTDLENNYWSIVGPSSREEYELLGGVKLKHLIDLGLMPRSQILDVGCGTGLLAAALEPFLDEDGCYVGTDLAAEAVSFCAKRFHRSNFSFLQNEMLALPIQNRSFDVIVFYSVFTHMYPKEIESLLAEARRLLAPNGFIFADAFTSAQVDKFEGDRGAVIVNDSQLNDAIQGAKLLSEEILRHEGPGGSQRRFMRLVAA